MKPKVIAAIIEGALLIIGVHVILILDFCGIKVPILPIIIVAGVLIFALILTLSLLRYDSLRDIRETFKETNLPLYTDKTTLQGHDIKDEEENKNR